MSARSSPSPVPTASGGIALSPRSAAGARTPSHIIVESGRRTHAHASPPVILPPSSSQNSPSTTTKVSPRAQLAPSVTYVSYNGGKKKRSDSTTNAGSSEFNSSRSDSSDEEEKVNSQPVRAQSAAAAAILAAASANTNALIRPLKGFSFGGQAKRAQSASSKLSNYHQPHAPVMHHTVVSSSTHPFSTSFPNSSRATPVSRAERLPPAPTVSFIGAQPGPRHAHHRSMSSTPSSLVVHPPPSDSSPRFSRPAGLLPEGFSATTAILSGYAGDNRAQRVEAERMYQETKEKQVARAASRLSARSGLGADDRPTSSRISKREDASSALSMARDSSSESIHKPFERNMEEISKQLTPRSEAKSSRPSSRINPVSESPQPLPIQEPAAGIRPAVRHALAGIPLPQSYHRHDSDSSSLSSRSDLDSSSEEDDDEENAREKNTANQPRIKFDEESESSDDDLAANATQPFPVDHVNLKTSHRMILERLYGYEYADKVMPVKKSDLIRATTAPTESPTRRRRLRTPALQQLSDGITTVGDLALGGGTRPLPLTALLNKPDKVIPASARLVLTSRSGTPRVTQVTNLNRLTIGKSVVKPDGEKDWSYLTEIRQQKENDRLVREAKIAAAQDTRGEFTAPSAEWTVQERELEAQRKIEREMPLYQRQGVALPSKKKSRRPPAQSSFRDVSLTAGVLHKVIKRENQHYRLSAAVPGSLTLTHEPKLVAWRLDTNAWLTAQRKYVSKQVSVAQIAELRVLYETLDDDGSDSLDAGELATAMRVCGMRDEDCKPLAFGLLEWMNKTRLGTLSFTEFAHAVLHYEIPVDSKIGAVRAAFGVAPKMQSLFSKMLQNEARASFSQSVLEFKRRKIYGKMQKQTGVELEKKEVKQASNALLEFVG